MRIEKTSFALGENKIFLKDKFEQIERLTAKTGIPAVYETNGNAVDLALNACEKVLQGYDRTEIELLILVTQSPVDLLPANSITLSAKLGLNGGVFTFDFNQGCSGFVQSFVVMEKLISKYKKALLVTSDCYRQKLAPDDRSTNAVFSDGACAMILENDDDNCAILYDNTITEGKFRDLLYQSCGNENNGKLHMSGAEIWLFTRKVVVPQIQKAIEFCEQKDIPIGGIYIHQASKVVVEGIKGALGKYAPKVFENYMHYGNTVSSTIPILINENPVHELEGSAIFAGFGVGLTSTVLVFK
jgi:3-oxoacyl-[acyl-carrier-protein] synthase III